MRSTAPSPDPSDPGGAADEPPDRRAWLGAVCLLLLHFALAVGGKFTASTTADEAIHLAAGLSYWSHNDYRLHPENGNLPQRWAALPAWLGGARLPPLEENHSWRVSSAWGIGRQMFHELGQDHFPILLSGRAMIALFSVATGALVFRLAWRFFGRAGAFVSLTLFAFSPDFLAHGALATSDACMTFFLLAATWLWWRHLHDGRARTWLLSALTLGLAFVAKFSAPLLVVGMVGTAVARALHPAPWHFAGLTLVRPTTKLLAAVGSAVGHAAIVGVVIWASYGFRFAAAHPDLPPMAHFVRVWETFAGTTGPVGRIVQFAATWRLLPEAFLFGFDYVLLMMKTRSAFLNGDYSFTGWRSFFVWTLLLKTTLPVLFAAAAGSVLLLRRLAASPARWAALYPATPLLLFFAIYWATSIASQLNIGHRHILPIYPVLFIAAGALGPWLASRRRVLAAGVAALLAWQAVEAIRIAPHHLAYFNPLGGGPAQGWRRLVDSSLDWGQDLPALQRWLERHAPPDEPVFLSYFGSGDPDYYGIRAHRTAPVGWAVPDHVLTPYTPGIYCISATILQQVYGSPPGPFTPELERKFQELRGAEEAIVRYSRDAAVRAELEAGTPPGTWPELVRRYDALRLARLCSYLRARDPDAHAGYSILIYRLTAEEVRVATRGSASELGRMIERAVAARSGEP
jgi:4-amino-4-deoxy-L-arabinose transferase-like glycosyltransferase